jgi:hypothetical protein
MESINFLDFICKNIFNPNKNSQKNINKIIDYCSRIQYKIINEDSKEFYYILELINIIDFVYNSITLMLLIQYNHILSECDKSIMLFINSFYNNKIIYEKLLNIKNKIDNNQLFVYEKIVDKFNKIHAEKSYNLLKLMNNIKENINKILEIDTDYDTSKIKKYINHDIPKNILLTKNSYFYLQRTISDSDIRNDIEKQYFKKSHNTFGLLSKLIIHRHNYALIYNKKTYFDYIKKKTPDESKEIRNLINDLIEKIDNKSRKEIERIRRELKKDGSNKKVDLYDIIYYYDKLKTKILFKPNNVLSILLNLLKIYFGLNIVTSKSNNLWNKSVITYEVSNSNNIIIGYLFVDLEKKDGSNINSPTAIRLSKKFKKGSNIITDNNVVLLSNYKDLNSNCMTYSDIVYLFKEFGNALQYLVKNYDGFIISDNQFNILFSQLMEYIAWEKSTITKLCSEYDSSVIDHILFTRYIDFTNSIKLRCINALFDHIIHNSVDLIDILKKNDNDIHIGDVRNGEVLFSLYKQIYSDIMISQKDIVNLNINGINPSIIYQQINGSECILYENVLTEILSYGIYYVVKQGKGNLFINSVLQSEPHKFRKALYEYISEIENSYDLYINEVIGINEIDTEKNIEIKNKFKNSNEILTDSVTNCFNENNSDDSSDEDIII